MFLLQINLFILILISFINLTTKKLKINIKVVKSNYFNKLS
jgi:hypothetical protein